MCPLPRGACPPLPLGTVLPGHHGSRCCLLVLGHPSQRTQAPRTAASFWLTGWTAPPGRLSPPGRCASWAGTVGPPARHTSAHLEARARGPAVPWEVQVTPAESRQLSHALRGLAHGPGGSLVSVLHHRREVRAAPLGGGDGRTASAPEGGGEGRARGEVNERDSGCASGRLGARTHGPFPPGRHREQASRHMRSDQW